MRLETAAARLVDQFQAQRPLRSGSLIITVYGDAIAPRGGTTWLGSLIALLEPFGLNPRLVRTSVFRLAKDVWLREFVEIYIRRDLKIALNRRELPG